MLICEGKVKPSGGLVVVNSGSKPKDRLTRCCFVGGIVSLTSFGPSNRGRRSGVAGPGGGVNLGSAFAFAEMCYEVGIRKLSRA